MMRAMLFLLIPAIGWTQMLWAAEDPNDRIAADTCVLELDLPPDATVSVDGRDHGQARQVTFRPLEVGTTYQSRVRITFAGGEPEEHAVLVESGHVIRLASMDPHVRRPEIVVQHGHLGGTACGALSPDGRRLVTGGAEGAAILWDMGTGRKVQVYQGHTGPILDVDFSSDGGRLLTTSADGSASLWDTSFGRHLKKFPLGETKCSALSSNGERVLVSSEGNTATIWDAQLGHKVHVLRGHTGVVDRLAFSSDGQHAVTGAYDRTAIVWDATTGEKCRVLRADLQEINTVCFSPDGRQVLMSASELIDGQ